ncbi:MAG: hypothetical protein R2830_00495 [Saprospiraceae bacterium]
MVPIVEPSSPARLPVRGPKQKFPFLRFLVWALLASFVLFAARSFIEFDENGIPRLAKWRETKLVKELNDLDGAEQYALTAEKMVGIRVTVALTQPIFICTWAKSGNTALPPKGKKGGTEKA